MSRMTDQTLAPGCYLEGSRGHYITRDAIELAVGMGYLLDPFARYALDHYDDYDDECYPQDALYELSNEVLDWLNGGPNEGIDRPIRGQNSPPRIPANHSWGWIDGDFGLYPDSLDNPYWI
jgi:hypothetical protein